MYKFIPFNEYDAHEIVDDVKVYSHPDKLKHPNARISPNEDEVVISCELNCPEATHTREQALEYIAQNW